MPRLKREFRNTGTLSSLTIPLPYVGLVDNLGSGETLLRTRVDVMCTGLGEVGSVMAPWMQRNVQLVSALAWTGGTAGAPVPSGFFSDLSADWIYVKQHVFETTTIFQDSLLATQSWTYWNSENSQTLDTKSMRAAGDPGGAVYLVHDLFMPYPVESTGFYVDINWISYDLVLEAP